MEGKKVFYGQYLDCYWVEVYLSAYGGYYWEVTCPARNRRRSRIYEDFGAAVGAARESVDRSIALMEVISVVG